MEEEVFFEKSIHINRFTSTFDLEDEDNVHVLENLLISLDGSIMGVRSEMIKPYLNEPEVRSIRYGIKPTPKKFEIKSEEDFYRTLAILTPLSET